MSLFLGLASCCSFNLLYMRRNACTHTRSQLSVRPNSPRLHPFIKTERFLIYFLLTSLSQFGKYSKITEFLISSFSAFVSTRKKSRHEKWSNGFASKITWDIFSILETFSPSEVFYLQFEKRTNETKRKSSLINDIFFAFVSDFNWIGTDWTWFLWKYECWMPCIIKSLLYQFCAWIKFECLWISKWWKRRALWVEHSC